MREPRKVGRNAKIDESKVERLSAMGLGTAEIAERLCRSRACVQDALRRIRKRVSAAE